MRKLFTEKAAPILKLTGDGHKHLSLVLRTKKGDAVTVSTGDGYDYFYTVDGVSTRETVLKQTGKRVCESEPKKILLTLFTAVLKGDKNDTVVRMCTELGVMRIIPFTSEFTVATKDSYKVERLQKIALEAAKQSGRGRVPEVCPPVTFGGMKEKLRDYDWAVFPYERAADIDIKTLLFNSPLGKRSDGEVFEIACIVGGEGGFSEKEAKELSDMDVTPVTLGKRILRADTACAAVCALILYEAGEMG